MPDFLIALAERKRNEAHSIFSPSSAHRWSRCPGSLIANALAPDRPSVYAAEGTVAHALADQWLKTGERPSHMVGQTVRQEGFLIDVTDQMLSYVQEYVDDVMATPGLKFFEQRLDHSSVCPIPDQKGTTDNIALRFGSATVRDFKYGIGRPVYVFKQDGSLNEQFGLYAVAVFDEWDWYYGFETFELQVSQPRVPNFDRAIITREQLLTFKEHITERAHAAWCVDAPRVPGDHCTDCGVRKDCPAFLAWIAAAAEAAADDVFDGPAMQTALQRADDPFDDPFDLPEISVEQWCRILPMRKAVEAWFAAGEAKVFGAAQAGFPTPGWKIVEGRSNRVWSDETSAQARMVEVGIPIEETETRKLLSPNQAEEALHTRTRMSKKKAAELFDSLTERKDGGLSLVRQSDKREAVPSHGDVFD